MGRKFERISAGGVRDEAEIRGHRRTYIGAMPGTIIRALRDAGSENPVFMIDEIDKMGSDYRGDPASAMLEVLDPEQNSTFRDHYLDVPYDLSRVMFITTANTLDTIPGPLRDRMEVIQLAGYTEEEKLQIAKRYLVPRQIERNGLKRSQIALHRHRAEGDHRGVHARGRRAQPRARDRRRRAARSRARSPRGRSSARCRSRRPRVRELLGRPRFPADVKRRTSEPGVATGLAWTPAGGDVLFVEASAMPGTGQADDHRPARRRDEGVRAGRALLRARARRRAARGLVQDPRPARPRAGRRDPQGRPERRHHDGHRADVAGDRAAGARRHGDDRRADAHRPGAADRRAEGEGARRPARRASSACSRRGATRPISRTSRSNLREGMEFVWVGEVGEVFAAALDGR